MRATRQLVLNGLRERFGSSRTAYRPAAPQPSRPGWSVSCAFSDWRAGPERASGAASRSKRWTNCESSDDTSACPKTSRYSPCGARKRVVRPRIDHSAGDLPAPRVALRAASFEVRLPAFRGSVTLLHGTSGGNQKESYPRRRVGCWVGPCVGPARPATC